MASSDESNAALGNRAGKLSGLFNLDEVTPERWSAAALSAMARHQFAAPLGFDLKTLALPPCESEAREAALGQAAANGIGSFEGLLFHREPPLEVLRLAKDFFKEKTRQYPKGSAEWQVAYLFYLLTIAAAGTHRAEISTLAAGELLKGIRWALEQLWVDERTKARLSVTSGD